MTPASRKTWLRRLGLAALLALACQQVWRHGHDYVFAEKFYEVEPGRVYRGAWQHTWPMTRIVRDCKLKTIVALAHAPEMPLPQQEKAFADKMGVRWVHIPIVEARELLDGSIGDQLERAVAVIADPANQPVYFHCHHGINRASMVQIAYRTLACGWTLEQATEEVSKTFGLVEVTKGPDYRYMAKFYRDRVLPRRAAEQAARESALRK